MSRKGSKMQEKFMSWKFRGEENARTVRLAGINSRKRQRVLVFGAGVIGAYLAHALTAAGNDVTVLAREARAQSLNRNGLVIDHHLQRKTTVDKVEAITDVSGREFDVTFVVMPYHKLKLALPQICRLHTELLVLVGNNIAPAEIQQQIVQNAPDVQSVLFGFQATAGKKEEDRYICERLGGGMDIGQLHGAVSPQLCSRMEQLFAGTSYRLHWQTDMESYLICHPAAILPIGYLSYICGGNLRRSTGKQRKLMFEASHEAYEFLKAKGITICPAQDDQFYEKGVRGTAMRALYYVMAKTKMGDLIACEHCRNAVTEMELIDLFYADLMKDYPAEKLKAWRELRSQMPSWEALHRRYGN